MTKIRYVGSKPAKTDNVAGTGLTWGPDEVLEVPPGAAAKLLQHPDVWAIDDEPPPGPKFGLVLVVGEHEQSVVLDDMDDAALRQFVDAHKLKVDKRKKGDALRSAIVDAAAPSEA